MAENQNKTKDDNKKRLLLALGLMLLGNTSKEDLQKIENFDDLPSEVKQKTLKRFEDNKLDKLTDKDEALSKEDTLKIAAETSNNDYFKIVSVGDDRVCEYCRQWQGKIVTMSGNDPRYKRLDEFLNSKGSHFGCRCYLQKYTPKKPTTKELNTMAMNAEPFKDTLVYRGFVDESLDKDIEYDFDETLVMLTPLGEFVGSSTDGKPMKEIVDEDSVRLMEQQSEEILLDKDHSSMRPIADRDTEAMGWISGLKAVTDLGSMSGLYGIIKWAGEGMRLVKERAYRFLSPVFELDSNGRAVKLLNVALTNRPALKMPPIINSESDNKEISITQTEKDIHMDINKDELVDLIKTTVTAMNSCASSEKKVEEVKNEEVVEVKEEQTAETSEKSVENAEEEKPVEVKEEVKNEDTVEKTEASAEEEKPVEKKEEIIKEEALNSAPTIGADISGKAEWADLHGDAFWTWLKKHPQGK